MFHNVKSYWNSFVLFIYLFLRCDEPLSSTGISKSISEGIIEEEEEEEEDGESNHKRKKEDDQEVTAVDLGPLYLRPFNY